jgi:hypothetical protein
VVFRVLFEEVGLFRLGSLGVLGHPLDLGPTLYKGVIGYGILCTFIALTDSVKAVGEFTSHIGMRAKLSDKFCRGIFSA